MHKLKKLLSIFVLFAFPMLAFANEVNVNTASKDQLLKGLEGINEAQAEAIVKYRDKEGAIVKLHELYHIEGVGRDLIAPNYNRLTVGDVDWGDKKS